MDKVKTGVVRKPIDEFEKPKFTWLEPCKHCPSHWYPPDLESRMIDSWGERESRSSLFACAWRKGGYCMGQSWRRFEEFGHWQGGANDQ